MLSKKSAVALMASLTLAATPAAALAGGKDGGKGGPKDPPACKKGDKKKECDSVGRMTGGGSVFGSNSFRTTHGFQIRCTRPDKSNLEVNWDSGNKFHATSFSNIVFDEDGNVVLNVSGTLEKGNHQAHK